MPSQLCVVSLSELSAGPGRSESQHLNGKVPVLHLIFFLVNDEHTSFSIPTAHHCFIPLLLDASYYSIWIACLSIGVGYLLSRSAHRLEHLPRCTRYVQQKPYSTLCCQRATAYRRAVQHTRPSARPPIALIATESEGHLSTYLVGDIRSEASRAVSRETVDAERLRVILCACRRRRRYTPPSHLNSGFPA